MDDSAIQLRVRVIVVSTRAALRSLTNGDAQASDVVSRGLALLADLEAAHEPPGEESRRALSDARAELTELQPNERHADGGRSISHP